MITVPLEGRQTDATSSEDLVGVDGNAFNVIGRASVLLRRAGASPAYISAFTKEATSGGYDHVIQSAMAYLDAEPVDADWLHCDLCDGLEYAGDLTTDWNGETGNHRSCEAGNPEGDPTRNGAFG